MVNLVRRAATARIESPADLSRRLPALSGIVSVPYLRGWASKRFSDLSTQVSGAIVRAVTSRELRKSGLAEDYAQGMQAVSGLLASSAFNSNRSDFAKRWGIEQRHNPEALEVLCSSPQTPFDGALVSSLIDASSRLGEMGRSRVLGALATRLLDISSALTFPEGVSRIFEAIEKLPWEMPAHEEIAAAASRLENQLFYDAPADAREKFDKATGWELAGVVERYSSHPRVAVVIEVAKATERQPLLHKIAERAMTFMKVDSRLTFRLVEAIASNRGASSETLRPFAKAELWTKGEQEKLALDALFRRSIVRPTQKVELEMAR